MSSLTIDAVTVARLSTPTLVREYRELHVTGSHRRLTNAEADRMSLVVDELRTRHVLD